MTAPTSATLVWTPEGAPISYTMGFDVVTNEAPAFDSQVTEHPVETGPNVVDNVRVALNKVVLQVFVSNEPISEHPTWGQTGGVMTPGAAYIPGSGAAPNVPTFTTYPQWVTLPIGVPLVNTLFAHSEDRPLIMPPGLPPSLGSVIQPTTLQFPLEFDAVQLTHDMLLVLRKNSQLIDVHGSKAIYANMVIEHFDMARSADTGSGAQFTIAFKEIRQVSTQIVNAPVPTKPSARTPVSKGKLGTLVLPEITIAPSTSLVKQWLGH